MKRSLIAFTLGLACLAPPAIAGPVEQVMSGRGVWVDHPKHFDADRAAFAKSLGMRRVHIMLNGDFDKLKPDCSNATMPRATATHEQVARAIQVADAAGLQIVLTAYIPPSRDQIETLFAETSDSGRLLRHPAVDAVEFDLEGSWVKSAVCGWKGTNDHLLAVDLLIERARELRPCMPVGVTVHSARLTNPQLGIDRFDWISAQSYSKCPFSRCEERPSDVPALVAGATVKQVKERDERIARAWTAPRNGPGLLQAHTAKTLAKAKPPVVFGLAGYKQFWNENHTVTEAMQLQHDQVVQIQQDDPRFIGASYWSLTNLRNDPHAAQMQAFLKASAGPPPAPPAQ